MNWYILLDIKILFQLEKRICKFCENCHAVFECFTKDCYEPAITRWNERSHFRVPCHYCHYVNSIESVDSKMYDKIYRANDYQKPDPKYQIMLE